MPGLDDVKWRYVIFFFSWIFLWTLIILPSFLPALDSIPSPLAYMIYFSGYMFSFAIILFAVMEELPQVTLATLVSSSGIAGLDNLFPPLRWPFMGTAGNQTGQNAAVDTAIGWFVQQGWPDAGNAVFFPSINLSFLPSMNLPVVAVILLGATFAALIISAILLSHYEVADQFVKPSIIAAGVVFAIIAYNQVAGSITSPVSWMFFLVYGIGSILLLIPPVLGLTSKDLRSYLFEALI